jgi:PPK2 family polyphosphate:nucleotide phosphotransferase
VPVKIDANGFLVREGDKVDLEKRPTRVAPPYASKTDYDTQLRQRVERMAALQQVLYAAGSHAVLIVLQGMDTSGKDGVIRHVLSGINPQGVTVTSFKQPTGEELAHDFLWRGHRAMPERGRIGVFNRSYYEEVVVVRVHPELLAREGAISNAAGKKFWRERYRSIVDMEWHLSRNATRIVKIFLHLSEEEQRVRLLARIDQPEKNWKFSMDDVAERARWKDYLTAYEHALSATSADEAPWFVVPADDKATGRLIVAEIIGRALEELDLRYPGTSPERRRELEAIRRRIAGQPNASGAPRKTRTQG